MKIVSALRFKNTAALEGTKAELGIGEGGGDSIPSSYLDTDTALTANSDEKVSTQKAVKTYVDTLVTGLLDFKGNIDCSGNPNYPAASKGDAYYVSVAGKVGGASGTTVSVGDMVVAKADNAGGTQASVGTSWFVLEANIPGITATGLSVMQAADAAAARSAIGAGTSSLPGLSFQDVASNAAKLALSGLTAGSSAVRVTGEKNRRELYLGGTISSESSWLVLRNTVHLFVDTNLAVWETGMTVNGVAIAEATTTDCGWVDPLAVPVTGLKFTFNGTDGYMSAAGYDFQPLAGTNLFKPSESPCVIPWAVADRGTVTITPSGVQGE